MSMKNLFKKSLVLSLILSLFGCVDLTGQTSRLEELPPSKTFKKPHAHIYTMRGFLGIFSRGMDTLAARCNKELNIPTVSVAANRWRSLAKFIIEQKKKNNLLGPLVLVGHSEGADDQIEVAQQLAKEKIPVDFLVLLGPFSPSPVPTNVKKVFNLDRSFAIGKIIPFMGNVKVRLEDPEKTQMETLDIGYTGVDFNTSAINHFNIDKSSEVQTLVINKIKQVLASR